VNTEKFQMFDRDGNPIPTTDDGILRDGARLRVRMMFADHAPGSEPAQVFDAFGGPAGHRPGACYAAPPANVAADFSAADAAVAEYQAYLADAWRCAPSLPAGPQLTGDAFADYEHYISNAWRTAR
jgi:hypothetical protein